MAQNIVDISLLNPLKFRRKDYVNPLPYNTRYPEDWNFQDTIPGYMAPADYKQPWQNNDIIYLHILSNYSPHNIKLWSCDGRQIDFFAASYTVSSIEITGLRVFRIAIALTGYDEGVYQVTWESGNPVIDTFETEWFEIKALHENSILFQYTHNENDYGVAFELGDEFRFRVIGGVTDPEPGTERRVFVDQLENMDQLSAKTFYTEKLIIGDALGVPWWVIQKINEIFRCSSVLIDGKQYRANDGSKWEPNREKDFPMAGWALDIRPAKISDSKRFIAEGDQDGQTTVMYNIQNRGFGPISNPASSNLIQIETLD